MNEILQFLQHTNHDNLVKMRIAELSIKVVYNILWSIEIDFDDDFEF